jgi:hypothetical protein
MILDPSVVLLLLTFAAVVFTINYIVSTPKNKNRRSYSKRKFLLTQNELNIFNHLNLICKDTDYYVCPYVRLVDLLFILDKKSDYFRSKNLVISKQMDFVLINKSDSSIFCVIEVNDSTHYTEKRKKRDTFVQKVLNQIEIPFVILTPNSQVEEIKQKLNSVAKRQ